ncbi:MAG TPA: DUF4199 domain-containing protein [Marinilabiliaceae bacterium]|nr:DUF4199 domain-containing protein [Marinilabiliaceae bacterium]
MDDQRTARNQFTLKYGALLGIIQVAWLLFLYATDNLVGSPLQSMKWVIFGVFLFLVLKFYRDHFLEGFISYGRCIREGVRLSVLAGIIIGAFYFLMLKVFDPELGQLMIAETEEAYLAMGISESKVEEFSEDLRIGMTPWNLFFANIFDGMLSGLIVSLVIAIFVKRKSDDPFHELMKNV